MKCGDGVTYVKEQTYPGDVVVRGTRTIYMRAQDLSSETTAYHKKQSSNPLSTQHTNGIIPELVIYETENGQWDDGLGNIVTHEYLSIQCLRYLIEASTKRQAYGRVTIPSMVSTSSLQVP